MSIAVLLSGVAKCANIVGLSSPISNCQATSVADLILCDISGDQQNKSNRGNAQSSPPTSRLLAWPGSSLYSFMDFFSQPAMRKRIGGTVCLHCDVARVGTECNEKEPGYQLASPEMEVSPTVTLTALTGQPFCFCPPQRRDGLPPT